MPISFNKYDSSLSFEGDSLVISKAYTIDNKHYDIVVSTAHPDLAFNENRRHALISDRLFVINRIQGIFQSMVETSSSYLAGKGRSAKVSAMSFHYSLLPPSGGRQKSLVEAYAGNEILIHHGGRAHHPSRTNESLQDEMNSLVELFRTELVSRSKPSALNQIVNPQQQTQAQVPPANNPLTHHSTPPVNTDASADAQQQQSSTIPQPNSSTAVDASSTPSEPSSQQLPGGARKKMADLTASLEAAGLPSNPSSIAQGVKDVLTGSQSH